MKRHNVFETVTEFLAAAVELLAAIMEGLYG